MNNSPDLKPHNFQMTDEVTQSAQRLLFDHAISQQASSRHKCSSVTQTFDNIKTNYKILDPQQQQSRK